MSENPKKMNGLAVIIIIIITGSLSSSFLLPPVVSKFSYEVFTFENYDEYTSFLQEIHNEKYSDSPFHFSIPEIRFESSSPNQSDKIAGSFDSPISFGGEISYSETNIQVEGVDEPDIIKTNGEYIFIVSNSKIFIVKSYPVNNVEVKSKISLSDMNIKNIFINENYLIVFGITHGYHLGKYEGSEESSIEPHYYSPSTFIKIFDFTNPGKPEEIKSIHMEGNYFDARMIEKNIYIISIQNLYTIYPYLKNESYLIPQIRVDNETYQISANDIYYIDAPETIDTTTHIAVVNLEELSVSQKSFLLGNSQTLYASKENIFLTSQHFHYTPWYISPLNTEEEKTIIHKISLNQGKLEYEGKGEVPGKILNQFSIDEHNGFLRIATTIGHVWDTGTQSSNNIYILNDTMEIIGSIEEIAPGEKIYSARFMGEKAYLVTFKKVDPFFTINLSDPNNPEILGKLKIPGYSDYLHPYDENHIIGIGKETVEALEDEKMRRNLDFAWYQGIKIALFDVSDFENPVEVSKVVIGDRGTNSPALHDHKAFLFDKERNLLVIPVSVYEIDEEYKQEYEYTGSYRGDFSFQGAYVYNLSIENGFSLKGRITHLTDQDIEKTGFYPKKSKSIFRTLFIEDYLYTISPEMVKINDLNGLTEITSIDLK